MATVSRSVTPFGSQHATSPLTVVTSAESALPIGVLRTSIILGGRKLLLRVNGYYVFSPNVHEESAKCLYLLATDIVREKSQETARSHRRFPRLLTELL